MIKYVLSLFYLVFTTLGITFMKIGGNSISLSFNKGINFKIGHITLLGFICYFISFILWQKVLTYFNLSYIVPIMTGLSQIIIIIISILVLKEHISLINGIGILVIIVGVILVSVGR